MPIAEPGLAEAFDTARDRITIAEALAESEQPDLVFVCVGTPIADDGEPDLSQLQVASERLRSWPDAHVSVRSTLPPGTSAHLPGFLGRDGGARLSTNPEFLRQGSAMEDYAHPTRIVIGRFPDTSPEHLQVLGEAYAVISAPRLEVSVAAAELIKNAANGFLALKLSFVNEIATLAEEYGVDVDEILEGIALDPRIGSAYMRPGMGFGGSCLPKELQVLASAGRRQGLPMHVARAAAQVNGEQQDRFVRHVLNALSLPSSRVGILGLSFKAFTDDLRGSPATYVARRLIQAGHRVAAFDPVVPANRAMEAVPGIEVVDTALDVFRRSDAVVIATEWPEFLEIDLKKARGLVRQPLLFDGRNLLNAKRAVAAGFEYRGVGRTFFEYWAKSGQGVTRPPIEFAVRILKPEEVRSADILEVGAWAGEGTAQERVRQMDPKSYLGTDIAKGPGVDVTCRAEDLVSQFGTDAFDIVLATEVVEHIRDWRAAFRNMMTVLRTGGLLVITTRSITYPYHGVPHDYWRYQPEDMRRILAGWKVEALETDPERPGIFVAARKVSATYPDLDAIALYSIALGRRATEVSTTRVLFHRLSSPRRAASWLLPRWTKPILRKLLTPFGYSTEYRGPKVSD